MKGEVNVHVEVNKSSRILSSSRAVFQPAAFAEDDRTISRLHITIEGNTYLIEWDPRTPIS